jgi:hypothetical protein
LRTHWQDDSVAVAFPIRELAMLLHDFSNQWKALALLRAYFDESGIHTGAAITGVAGFIGPTDEWEALEAEWSSELKRFSRDTCSLIKDFHAYECESGDGAWSRIPHPIRDAYNRKLAITIKKYKRLHGIAIAIDTNDWLSIPSVEFKKRFVNPYNFCSERCFESIASYSINKANNTPVALVFAEHQSYSSHVKDIFEFYLCKKRFANIRSLSFLSPNDCIPLQTADMLSYESYRSWHEAVTNGLEGLANRPGYRILADAGHFEWAACYGGNGLRNAVTRYHFQEGLPDPYPVR